jgi:hypothetical protein
MTHCVRRSRAYVGHQTVTGPVTPTCLQDRWGRVEAVRTALGEALVMRRRTRVRFPPPPPLGVLATSRPPSWRKAGATADSGGPGFVLSWPWPPHRRAAAAELSPAPPGRRHRGPYRPSGSAPAAPWLWPRPHRSTPPASRSSPGSRSGPARSGWTGAPSTAHLRLCNSPGPTHRGAGRNAEFCGSRRSSSRARSLSTGQW